MSDKLTQQYEAIKAEYETVQKTLAEMESRETGLKRTLTQLNFNIQVHARGVTRNVPGGFMAGGAGR